jgi:hypothetical protein
MKQGDAHQLFGPGIYRTWCEEYVLVGIGGMFETGDGTIIFQVNAVFVIDLIHHHFEILIVFTAGILLQ